MNGSSADLFMIGLDGDWIIAPDLPRRACALAFIVEQIARYGISPSYAEIGRHLRVSQARAGQLVHQLVERGMIERAPGAHRGFRVVDMDDLRAMLGRALKRLGWTLVTPIGAVPAVEIPPLLPPLMTPDGQANASG